METQSSELIKEVINATKISSINGVPRNISQQIVPVIEVNPKLVKESFVKFGFKSTTGSLNIFTAPANQDCYITSIQLSMIKDAACDMATGVNSISATVNSLSSPLIYFSTITLTAQNINIFASFSHPIKVDRGTGITIGGTFAAGVCVRAVTIQGFIDECSNA